MKIVVGFEMVIGVDNKSAGDSVPAGDLRQRGVAGRERLPLGLGQDAFAGVVHAPAGDGRQSFRRDVREDNALLGELVQTRRLDPPAAVAAHVVGPEGVRNDDNDVEAAELVAPAAGPRVPDHTGAFSAAFWGQQPRCRPAPRCPPPPPCRQTLSD